MAKQLRDRLVALLDARLRDRGVGGLAVARGAAPEILAAWLPESLPREPAFLIYSVTKTFTATLALVLQEEGRFSLADPLARWFPEIPGSPTITVRALLNHTAGVPDYGGRRAYHDAVRRAPGEPWSFDEFARHSWQGGLLSEPGAGWAYSNPGYLLVKRVLERVADERQADLVQSRLCRRPGLEHTFVPESVAALASLAPATSTLLSAAQEPRDVRLAYHPGWVSHGVVASTPSEVARFLHALFSEQIVGRESLRELTTLVPVPKGPPRWLEPSYGLGVMADPASPWGPLFGHSGGGPGYGASAFHAPGLAPGGSTVCAACAVEEDFLAENLALDALDSLRGATETKA
jgi:D-alanyl-D-alanine carboxypeptidase